MAEQNQSPDQVPEEFPLGPGTTGRYVIVTAPAQRIEDAEQGLTTLSNVAGVSPDEASEAGEVDPEVLTDPQASVNFPDLGILVAGAWTESGPIGLPKRWTIPGTRFSPSWRSAPTALFKRGPPARSGEGHSRDPSRRNLSWRDPLRSNSSPRGLNTRESFWRGTGPPSKTC